MSHYVNNDKAVVKLPDERIVVTVKRQQEDSIFRLTGTNLGELLSCEITFGSYGESRRFFLQATAEILGVPDPHSLPDAPLSRNHLMTAFANSILEKYKVKSQT